MSDKNQSTGGTAAIVPYLNAGVADLLSAGKAVSAQPVTKDGYKPVLVLPDHFHLEELKHAEATPLFSFIQANVTLQDPESFAAYVLKYKTSHTQLFATLPNEHGEGGEFLAIFDYHKAKSSDDGQHEPDRTAHRAKYPCPLDPRWKRWFDISGDPQGQRDFIDFIDANMGDIVFPDGASLMELAQNFEANTTVRFQSRVDRVTGGRQLTFNEEVEAGQMGKTGQIKVPDLLRLNLPVFDGGKAYDVEARVQWIPKNGGLSIIVTLRNAEERIRHALQGVREDIQAATDLGALIGKLGF